VIKTGTILLYQVPDLLAGRGASKGKSWGEGRGVKLVLSAEGREAAGRPGARSASGCEANLSKDPGRRGVTTYRMEERKKFKESVRGGVERRQGDVPFKGAKGWGGDFNLFGRLPKERGDKGT